MKVYNLNTVCMLFNSKSDYIMWAYDFKTVIAYTYLWAHIIAICFVWLQKTVSFFKEG
jgi:hypothetical protein